MPEAPTRHKMLQTRPPKQLQIPSDKSISHRSLLLASLCRGESHIHGLLESADVLATRNCLQQLGVQIERSEAGTYTVTGGLPYQEPPGTLDTQNSGTTARLLCGLLAAHPLNLTLTGDNSLQQRPMERVLAPLQTMGASVQGQARTQNKDRFLPIQLSPPDAPLQGLRYSLPVASAQVKSALLLAGLFAKGATTLIEPAPSRDHTERMLTGMGFLLSRNPENPLELTLPGEQLSVNHPYERPSCSPREWQIPGDFSSAAFWMVWRLLSSGGALSLPGVGLNPTRTGLLHALHSVGANIEIAEEALTCGEPVGDLLIYPSELKGDIHITDTEVPRLIDEFPILAVAGVYLNGTLTVEGAGELRHKESDRIQTLAEAFKTLGIEMNVKSDGFVLVGNPDRPPLIPHGPIATRGDHRIAMALSILESVNQLRGGQTQDAWPIQDKACVAISYPTFYQHLQALQ